LSAGIARGTRKFAGRDLAHRQTKNGFRPSSFSIFTDIRAQPAPSKYNGRPIVVANGTPMDTRSDGGGVGGTAAANRVEWRRICPKPRPLEKKGLVPMMATVFETHVLARNWGAIVLRGIVGILFGIACIAAPGISLAALVVVFAVYAFADGLLEIVSAMRGGRAGESRWFLVLEGLLGIGVAVVTVFWPGITTLALLYLVAVWALVGGVFEIAAGIRSTRWMSGAWLLVLSGIASVALGILLFAFPGPSALALVLWVGVYALVSGIFLVALGIRLRSFIRTRGPGGDFRVHAPG
jgi:uncharacterized membrane protein HdeD (DUF308 family)